MECVFCKIINKEIPSEIIFEDDDLIIFKDANPKAKIHLLVVPKKHIATIDDLEKNDVELIGKLILVAAKTARDLNFYQKGYKLQFNVGRGGGQEVFHIHLHITSN